MVPYFKFKFDRHNELKETLLMMIDKQSFSPINEKYNFNEETKITKTDWFVDIGKDRDYWNFFYPIIFSQLSKYYTENLFYDFVDNSVKNVWFQQYYQTDGHTWHRHVGSTFNNVYFLEFEKGGPATEFKTPITKELVSANVEEGDVLIFPSAYCHRSPPNVSSNRKTVIAFNVL